MTNSKPFDVIIIGGSYAGLAAAMALGRAIQSVLVIDDSRPCNRQTPYSHNFLTNDGRRPAEIASIAHLELRRYDTVKFFNGTAVRAIKSHSGFSVQLITGEEFIGKRLIFATGIKDKLADIDGLEACWGISVLHCPYCHGYEERNAVTGILGNGDSGFDFARLISNWTDDLTLFTNGPSTLSVDQTYRLKLRNIKVVGERNLKVEHCEGRLQHVLFEDGKRIPADVLYAPAHFDQSCKIPESLGCELTDEGHLKIDGNMQTTIKNIFAIGDNASKMRTVANAVAMGTSAGILISKTMILESF